MALDIYNYDRNTEYSFLAGCRRAFDITPSSDDLEVPTRAIMVSADDITVTGVFVGQTDSHTTFSLKSGTVYPFCFKKITSVSSGSVKGYA